MNHALRNSLILLVILIVVILYFYTSIRNINRQILEVQAELRLAENEMEIYGGMSPDSLRVSFLLAQKDYLERWHIENSKFFLQSENSKISWEYLQNIIRRFNPDFQFDFSDASNQSGTQYNVSGSSRVSDLYIFISFIEKLGALYTIESVSLTPNFVESDDGPVNLINFTMLLKPHRDSSAGLDVLTTPFRRIAYTPLRKDPFRPAVYNPMVDPTQERLVSYQNLTLVSFSGNQAFFLDRENNLITLTPNTPVAYGYFSHMDEESRAVFRINRTGLYETVYIN